MRYSAKRKKPLHVCRHERVPTGPPSRKTRVETVYGRLASPSSWGRLQLTTRAVVGQEKSREVGRDPEEKSRRVGHGGQSAEGVLAEAMLPATEP